jgi:hypothetical protein
VWNALAIALRWLRGLRGLRPIRHFAHTPASTPTGDYSPRASHFPGGQGSQLDLEGDPEWGSFRLIASFQEAELEDGNSFSRRRYEEGVAETVELEATRDNELILAGRLPADFVRLTIAVKRYFRLPDDAVVWNRHEAFLLWGQALQARHSWTVETRYIPDRKSETGQTIYVRFRDFEEWANACTEVRLPEAKDVPRGPLAAPKPPVADGGASISPTEDCLPSRPRRKNAWYEVIEESTSKFVETHGHCPNEAQAWAQLCENPPDGYGIRTGDDRGEDAILMGDKPLSRSAFAKRWERYTKSNARQ